MLRRLVAPSCRSASPRIGVAMGSSLSRSGLRAWPARAPRRPPAVGLLTRAGTVHPVKAAGTRAAGTVDRFAAGL